ncbi:MAG TPA: NHLP leader peptide family RiPP precursor [Thermoanaerobaculia bacterium]|nr:NHLP leader peptide family RiPP precursor [Thermoanaerobaculia bacterium]
MAEKLSRGAIQDMLTKFAMKNPKYRAALIKNPKAVIEGQLNNKLPAGIKVKAVEETADTIYVIVPYVAKAGAQLSDGALEMVAGGGDKGGTDSTSYECNGSIGGQNTHVEFNADVSLV